jgi:hypothetical protein
MAISSGFRVTSLTSCVKKGLRDRPPPTRSVAASTPLLLQVGTQPERQALAHGASHMAATGGVVAGGQVREREVAHGYTELARVHRFGAHRRDDAGGAGLRVGGLGQEVEHRVIDAPVEDAGHPVHGLAHPSRIALEAPQIGNDMVHAPQPRLRVQHGPVEDLLQRSRCAENGAYLAGGDGARAQQSALRVRSAEGHRRSRVQAQVGGRRGVHRAQASAAVPDRRKYGAWKAQSIDPVPRPLARLEVEQQRFAGLRRFGGDLAA